MSDTYVRSLHSSNCFGQMSNVPNNISGTSKADVSKASLDSGALSLLRQAQERVEKEEFEACLQMISDAPVSNARSIATECHKKSLQAVTNRDRVLAQLYSDAMSKQTNKSGRDDVEAVFHARGVDTSVYDGSTKA
jgi:hypothetical protein